MRYLVKLTTGGKWEEVTEHLFKNRQYALNDNNTAPRYSKEYITVDGSQITLSGTIDAEELAKLVRAVGGSLPSGSYPPIVSEPLLVTVVKPHARPYKYELKTGAQLVDRRTQKEIQEATTELKKAA